MKIHVLIVEDDPINLKLTSSVLEEKGHTVIAANDAEKAHEMLQVFTPDVILMDLNLPRMDGLTLTRQMKADPKLKHVPIIAFTADTLDGAEKKALEAGCLGYITKPIDTRTFADRVVEYFLKSLG